MNTIYWDTRESGHDFSKAFDQVDHDVLLAKLSMVDFLKNKTE